MRNYFLIFTCFLFFVTFISTRQAKAEISPLFPVIINSKTGYINEKGKLVVQPKFDEGWHFSEGLAPVRIGSKWGYLNTKGNIEIKFQFFQASLFKEGLASVGIFFKRNRILAGRVGYYGYINKYGQVISKQKLLTSFDFSDGLARVQTTDYKHCFLDKTSRLQQCQESPNQEDFHEGLSLIHRHGKYGYVNKRGKTVIEPKYDVAYSFSEGLAAVRINGKTGYIDKSGTIVIKPQFEEAHTFSDGLAAIKIASQWGFIDKRGKVVISPQFFEVGDFHNGIATINTSGKEVVDASWDSYLYINKQGKTIWKYPN